MWGFPLTQKGFHIGPASTYQNDDCKEQDSPAKSEDVVRYIPPLILTRNLDREIHPALGHGVQHLE